MVGLTAEARLLRGSGFRVGIGGGTPEGAGRAAATLVAGGATALVSFGLAGGLNPALPAGSLVIPSCVVEAGMWFQCDPGLITWLGGATTACLLAGAEIAVTAAQKSALFAALQADAIDLESGAAARVAKSHNIPFAVLRAVADPAGRTLPPAALIALSADGKISLAPIIASVLRNPSQIPALLALARDAAKARAALLKHLPQLQSF